MCHGEGVSVINHLHIVFMTFDAEGPLLGFNLCGSQETVENSGIPDHLTYLLRNLYAGQEAKFRIGHGTTDWFQIGKGVR